MSRGLLSLFLLMMLYICLNGQGSVYFKVINTDEFNFNDIQDVAVDKIGRHWVVSDKRLLTIENGKTSLASVYFNFSVENVISVAIEEDFLFILYQNGEYVAVNLMNNNKKTSIFPNTETLYSFQNKVYLRLKNEYYTLFEHKKLINPSTEKSKIQIENNNLKDATTNQNLHIYTNKKFLKDDYKLFNFHNRFYALEDNTIYELDQEVAAISKILINPNFKNHEVRSCLPLGQDNYIIALNDINALFVYKDSNFIHVSNLPQNKTYFNDKRLDIIYHSISLDENNILLLSSNSKIYNLHIQTLQITENKKFSDLNISYKNIFKDRLGNIWIGSYTDKLIKYNPKEEKMDIFSGKDCPDLYDVYRIFEDRNGIIWLGLTKGIIGFNPRNQKFITFDKILTEKNLNLNLIAISSIEHDNHGRLWLGTYTHGLHYINYHDINEKAKNKTLKAVSLLENSTFTEDNIKYLNGFENKLFVRTFNSLSEINIEDLYVKTWTTKEGFPNVLNNNYNYIENNQFYIYGTFGGIGKYDIRSYASSKNNPIKCLFTNGKQSPLIYSLLMGQAITLTDDISIIQASVSQSNRLPQWQKYVYRFDDSQWHEPIDNSIVLLSTDKGSKTLEIKQKYGSLLYEDKEIIYTIILKKAWYKTNGFLMFLFITIFSILYLLYNYYNKSKKYKIIANNLEMESLRSQMNPHFISNALNSINYYILESKTDEASLFIIKFSKLIRKILNNTSKEFITIQEELDSLKMYIDMEKMRFKEKFTYNIEVDDNVDKFYEVPSLILQPTAENAIWHGLMQKKTNGHLEIRVKYIDNHVQISIIDDGIGIENAKAIKSKQSLKRKSFGQNIVKRRLEILNQNKSRKYSIFYNKKSTEDLENPGTIVTINL